MQPLGSLPACYGTRRFITAFTRALLLSISWAIPIQSTPPQRIYPPTYILVLLVVSFPLAIPPITYMHFSFPHSGYMPRPLRPPWLDFSNYTWRRVKITKLLVMQFSPPSRHFIPLWSEYSPCRICFLQCCSLTKCLLLRAGAVQHVWTQCQGV
jgi:hypothetical protein